MTEKYGRQSKPNCTEKKKIEQILKIKKNLLYNYM